MAFLNLKKILSRKWFGIVVSIHLFSGTPLDIQLFPINLVFDEEISDIDVLGAPGGAENIILFKKHGTPVVLVDYNSRVDIVLSLKEIVNPNHTVVIPCHKFCFSGTFGIDFLLG